MHIIKNNIKINIQIININKIAKSIMRIKKLNLPKHIIFCQNTTLNLQKPNINLPKHNILCKNVALLL